MTIDERLESLDRAARSVDAIRWNFSFARVQEQTRQIIEQGRTVSNTRAD